MSLFAVPMSSIKVVQDSNAKLGTLLQGLLVASTFHLVGLKVERTRRCYVALYVVSPSLEPDRYVVSWGQSLFDCLDSAVDGPDCVVFASASLAEARYLRECAMPPPRSVDYRNEDED
jgi:hypothetical protein